MKSFNYFSVCLVLICALLKTSSAAISSTFSTKPDTIEIGLPFVATCTVAGFDSNSTYKYDVTYYLNTSNTNHVLGTWTVEINQTTTFLSVLSTEDYGLTIAQGDVGAFPTFEAKFNLLNSKSDGGYKCSVRLFSNESDTNGTELYYSNQIDSVPPLLSASLALNPDKNFKVGTHFSALCTINGTQYQDTGSSFNVSYYFTSSNGGNKIAVGQWSVSPSKNESTFTGVSLTELITSSGSSVSESIYEAEIKPEKVEASGKYQCSILAQGPGAYIIDEYFSNEISITVSKNGVSALLMNPTMILVVMILGLFSLKL